MRVVLDSNIVYSGLYSSKGASNIVLQLVGEGKVTPILSVALYEEYQDVLGRPPLVNDFGDDQKQDFLDYFCKVSDLTDIYFLWRPFLKDPKDDLVLEAAVAGGTKIIITHNLKDFKGIEKFGIEAITPGEFIKKERFL